jgi:hypothetical protein
MGRDHERHAALMGAWAARSRAHHRSDVAAVAARHGDHGRPVDAAVPTAVSTTESLRRRRPRSRPTAQYEPVRVVRRFVEVAVGEDVDVRVPRFATLRKTSVSVGLMRMVSNSPNCSRVPSDELDASSRPGYWKG